MRAVCPLEKPARSDARISGALASLAGLERALQLDNAQEIELAIGRILLLHAIILSIGGIPLIYLGRRDRRAQRLRLSRPCG
ncbi:MAG: hypothetical protein R2911_09790 [Caldilineaceae bacterium]